MNIGVLASHEGTTLQAVLDACDQGVLAGRVTGVISNNSGSGALRRAHAAGIRAHHLSSKTHPDPMELDRAIHARLADANADVVLLAGYMKKLGPGTLRTYSGRLLNTHPALLPDFGGPGMFGMHVHRAVLAAGAKRSGATVHLVEGEYDSGPVVAQRAVLVLAHDTAETLAQRVQAAERELLVSVLEDIARGRRTLPLGGTARQDTPNFHDGSRNQ
jgi:phosphoribosylglycinamide formyltransferase-1